MRNLSIGSILAIVALVLGVLALLDVFHPLTAVALAVICLAVVHLLPMFMGKRGRL
ncbi:MAG TPA: hypothetical protein VGR61_04025 [Candidatus Dormibacteraeota bacterium]|nr:hypothetical protein [Candidatus Dormibacteraeota bacterium]